MSGQSNRRQFLQASAVAGAGFWAAGGVIGEDKVEKKLERLNFACIGIGGKGDSDANHAAMFGDVVAICDIDDQRLQKKGQQKGFDKAAKFHDFREIFSKMGDKVDAVVISTPDHTHAVAAMMAMKAGKHVYCQKPLTHSVAEARALRKAAKDYKVCTQMGNQGTALDNFRTSVELLRSGNLGKIKEVHVWTNRPTGFWKQSPGTTKRPESKKCPEHVKFDLFLGPAPERPYADGYHPFAWRGWLDFGTGALGDMACHTANMPYMGLDLGLPTSIVAENEAMNPETYPAWAKVAFEFPAKGKREAVTFYWYEGTKDGKKMLPAMELFHGEKPSGSASLIVGEDVVLFSPDDYGASRKLLGKRGKEIKMPEQKTLKRRGGNNDQEQKKEWVEAIKAGKSELAFSNFEYAALLTESILLGNAAMKAGKKLEYNGEKGVFTDGECNKFLSREYRTGWKL